MRVGLLAFFVLTFVLSWAVWGSRLAYEQGLAGWQLGEPFVYFAVSGSAVATTWMLGRGRALRAFARRLLLWRVPARWYAAALLLPALPALAAVGVYLTFGGQHDVSALVPLGGALPLLLSQLALHLLTEEAGWRGFALPRLRVLLGPVTASLVLGLVWAAWHIPMFFVSG
ncbi:MAG TPA: CPBP family intramembrane glutamic endopeptidase, partial [Propionibacteriaceae bacterium]|nr:CPBP family intramembrane glutamic endopeptidase [Propionibacteriaceae bacterium]